jgi:hypothetical protein
VGLAITLRPKIDKVSLSHSVLMRMIGTATDANRQIAVPTFLLDQSSLLSRFIGVIRVTEEEKITTQKSAER